MAQALSHNKQHDLAPTRVAKGRGSGRRRQQLFAAMYATTLSYGSLTMSSRWRNREGHSCTCSWSPFLPLKRMRSIRDLDWTPQLPYVSLQRTAAGKSPRYTFVCIVVIYACLRVRKHDDVAKARAWNTPRGVSKPHPSQTCCACLQIASSARPVRFAGSCTHWHYQRSLANCLFARGS